MTNDMTGGARGERATGTPNTIYDLASVLFHALEGGASYDTYIQDAEEAGDEELVAFFIQVRDEDSMRADEAQRLLAERTLAGTATGAGGATPAGGLPRMEDMAGGVQGQHDTAAAPVSPMTGPGRREPDVPPRTEEAGPLGREGAVQPERDREEDKGLMDKAKDALMGEEESRRREGSDRPDRR
jgi:hypothetical protein